MKLKLLLLLSLMLVSSWLMASPASELEPVTPDMEQEILRQLKQIRNMGKKWDKKLEEAHLQTKKDSLEEKKLEAL